jgi:hypothetical protein
MQVVNGQEAPANVVFKNINDRILYLAIVFIYDITSIIGARQP